MSTQSRRRKKRLVEGGGAFTEVNSAVPKPLLDANIVRALELVGLADLRYEVVGNKHKEFFGDIDIATDSSDIASLLGIESSSRAEFFKALQARLSPAQAATRVVPGLSQFHILSPLVDRSGNQIEAVDRDGKTTGEPGMIQIDVFVGNLEWMAGINSGAPLDSKYKAVYRNVLLSSIVGRLVFPTEDPEVFERYVLNFRDGMRKDLVRRRVARTGTVKWEALPGGSTPVTTSPDGLAATLFGPGTRWSDIESFEKLRSKFNSPDFKFPQFRDQIIDRFSQESAKLPQGPVELQEVRRVTQPQLVERMHRAYLRRLHEVLGETDVRDTRGNVVIQPGLKVRHKKTQLEYTVDAVEEDSSGDVTIRLRNPEEPRFEPSYGQKFVGEEAPLLSARPDPEEPIGLEPLEEPGRPSLDSFDLDAPASHESGEEIEFVIDEKEFEKDYEVK